MLSPYVLFFYNLSSQAVPVVIHPSPRVKISEDGTTATRTDSWNCGLVISEYPLCIVNGEKTFQVKIVRHGTSNHWAGSVQVGIVIVDPNDSSTQVW